MTMTAAMATVPRPALYVAGLGGKSTNGDQMAKYLKGIMKYLNDNI